MNHNKDIIHLGIAFDKNYFLQFFTLLKSIFDSNSKLNISFHCIATGISTKNRKKIDHLINNNNSTINFYDIDEQMVSRFVTGSDWTKAAYYRLLFPFLVSDAAQKLLYIDSDTLVLNNLEELYNLDLNHYPVAAVYDNYVKTQPLLGINEEGQYFNSGVLLVDMPRWKEQKVSEKCFDYLLQFPERIRFVDQCALNAVLKNNWKKLPERFNLITSYIPANMNKKQKAAFISDKVILHYTLERPWHFLCKHPYRKLYHYYFNKKPNTGTKIYSDFSYLKIPDFLRIRLIEFYLRNEWLQELWRKIKMIFHKK